MIHDLIQQFEANGYWFNLVGQDRLYINVQDPSEAPAIRDLTLGRGVVMSVQVTETGLLAKWAEHGAGYDETWEFANVTGFMTFLDAFLTDGIDAV